MRLREAVENRFRNGERYGIAPRRSRGYGTLKVSVGNCGVNVNEKVVQSREERKFCWSFNFKRLSSIRRNFCSRRFLFR